jgi:AbrB family looped-hinge helix DNA binding protein
MDAPLTLSSKAQLVIPARIRQLLGLNSGDRLELSLQADGLLLRPHGSDKTTSAKALIGCTGYAGHRFPWSSRIPPVRRRLGRRVRATT